MSTAKKILDSTAFFSQSTLLDAIEDAANETILISPFPLAHAWPMSLMCEFGNILLVRNILDESGSLDLNQYLALNNPYTELLKMERTVVEDTVVELVRLGLAEYYDADAMMENDSDYQRSHELRMAILQRRDEADRFLLAPYDLDIIVHAVVNSIPLYSSNRHVSSGKLFRIMGLDFNAKEGKSIALENVPISNLQEYLDNKKQYESRYKGYSWEVTKKIGKVFANLGVNYIPVVSNVASFVTAGYELRKLVEDNKSSKFEHIRQQILNNIHPPEIQRIILEFNQYRMREIEEQPYKELLG